MSATEEGDGFISGVAVSDACTMGDFEASGATAARNGDAGSVSGASEDSGVTVASIGAIEMLGDDSTTACDGDDVTS